MLSVKAREAADTIKSLV